MTSHFDDRETRAPEIRESETFANLRTLLERSLKRLPALASWLGHPDPAGLTDRAALAALPVLRKPDLMEMRVFGFSCGTQTMTCYTPFRIIVWKRACEMAKACNDIKAPDGYLLGGLRRVRKDGSILFQRGWWELPEQAKKTFIGEDVWVHIDENHGSHCGAAGITPGDIVLEVAHPGLRIYEARSMKMTVIAERNDRPDARLGIRAQWRKDWHAKTSAA